MNKALWAVMTMLLIAMASLALLARQQATQIGVLRAENKTATEALQVAAKQRKLDASTIAAWQARNAATARQFAADRAVLDRALQAHSAWAEADVPAEVQQALQRPEKAPQ